MRRELLHGQGSQRKTARRRGALCLVSAAFFFAGMAVFVRLAGDLPTFEKALFRNLIALVVSGCAVMRSRIPFKAVKPGWVFVLLRAAAGTVGLLCNFYAIDRLNLSDASILNKMSPFYAVLFSFLILRERVSPRQVVVMVLAFFGSLLVVKPSPSNLSLVPGLIAAFGGLATGAAMTGLRGAAMRGVPRPLIIFCYSVFSTAIVIPLMLPGFRMPDLRQLVCMLLAGCCSAAGQFSLTAGYGFAPAREISVFDFSQVVFAAGFGALLFGQHPDLLSFLGYLIIIGLEVFCFIEGHRNTEGK